MNLTQAQHFKQALELLQSGQCAQALPIAEALAQQAPQAADAWQLLGMCLADNGRQTQADAAFERALALLPGNAMVSRNYGLSLAKHGKALRAQGQLDAAEPVLRKALALSPEQPSAWVDLGAVLRLLGRIDEALAAYRSAERLLQQRGISAPELQDAINGVLADAGRPAEALAGARRLVAQHPSHAPAHETLGNLLWENGAELAPGEDPLGEFRIAARAQPDNRALQLAFARMLVATKHADEALAVLHLLRRREPGNAVLDWFAAEALDALQQHEQAAALYASAARSELGALPDFLNARARHAFRTQRFDLAASCSEKAVTLDPHNQEGWSHLGTAWRLAGDEREHWLFDYDRLVGYAEIAPPPGFDDVPAFLQTLAATLNTLHSATREPVNQSVRGGTQTAGQLFGRDDAVIRAAETTLRMAVENWLATLPDDATHPFLSRKQHSVHFVGSWSVKLRASGRHANHIHSKGWASSAFYVALPDSVLASNGASRAGWIQFGQPLEDLGLALPPRRVIQPKPGHLALFPSCMWHGTVPFDDPQSRLTIAFDVQPKK
ncbi:tetratricopeptide repeat protein [Flavobacterium sp. MXW15]|uniref:Tetratricopeptide repeat protein n=1 Tax=Xanthomonas chitinilytica TaxID=2989819 RepID=A0ABT3JWP2_9XANT|nr:tetratricopeptide repeat protein [Xanthomonas sp. H13-6]MCW4455626.1 tetratricopeptide repeat protein [Flavobacterium sp. MXW15]MCW4472888.1 tetratricopeptide repeat protein [Xanthomonas sp. H13-6]